MKQRILLFVFVLLLALSACAQRGPSSTSNPTDDRLDLGDVQVQTGDAQTIQETICSVNAPKLPVPTKEEPLPIQYDVFNTTGRNSIRTLEMTKEGVLGGLAGEGTDSLFLFDGENWQYCRDSTQEGPSGHINDIILHEGILYVGSDGGYGVVAFRNDQWTPILTLKQTNGTWSWENTLSDPRTYVLSQTPQGELVVGHYEGVDSLDQGAWYPRPNYISPRSSRSTHAILFVDDQVWRGSISKGLDYWDGSKWTHYGVAELGSENVRSLVLGPDNAVWVATDGGGIGRFDPIEKTWTRYEPPSLSVLQVAFDKYGRPWAATSKGAYYLEGDLWSLYGSHWPILSLAFGIEDGKFTPDDVFLGSDGFGLIHGKVPMPLK